MSNTKSKIIVIGGGPAGMMSAIRASEVGCEVLLIEKNEKLGKKLYITGKGRCNLTNNCTEEDFFKNVARGEKFLKSAIYSFSPEDTISFFEENGLKLKTERGGRVFPESDKSSDVLSALIKKLKELNVLISLNETVKHIKLSENGEIGAIITDKATYSDFSAVILATGGLSYPLTGSTGDGFKFAKTLGHTVTVLSPSLVPFVFSAVKNAKNEWINPDKLSYPEGLSLKNVTAKVSGEGFSHNEFGEMLFTANGASGPIVLTLSSKTALQNILNTTFSIDLKPALTWEECDKRVLKDFSENINKQFKNSLCDLLPKSLIGFIIELSGIPSEKPINLISRAERAGLTELLKNLSFKIKGTEGFNHAIITAGGISLNEINPKTMQSKLVPNLYFAGEILNTDAYTGGYNMQIAFASGFLAGNYLTQK
ncbi:MAG: NAD(P)/FAD-dependent oxidoreductase [Firmicutes bacterium]|nr:NAD(P)/FAD-dependent oxidoreductase [Bacillota bacterium]